MAREGAILEQVVHTLERALATNPTARIHRNHRLPDRITGQSREHDVVLEIPEAHHSIRIAIECRDRSRPVGVSQVEAFAQKCADTGISRGVIVSPAGFCKTAITKAAHLSITCMTLREVETLAWSEITHLTYRSRILEDSHCHIIPAEDGVIDKKNVVLMHEGKTEVTSDLMQSNIQRVLDSLTKEISEPIQHAKAKITLDGDLTLVDSNTLKIVPVKQIICDVTYSLEITKIPMSNIRYCNEETGELVSEAVACNIDVHGVPVTVMILGNGDSARSVKLLSNNSAFKFNPIILP